ncbi:rac GTPase-activating protein 1-like [Rhincodon typus]|uniref:rac GTPase-activating protein 1-like n=1 Tax=Rhincodon typus TaxID=259920 RepID=UPI00202E4450|nr:rac GTPase-activating protein 1-like [Rhincodon typus]
MGSILVKCAMIDLTIQWVLWAAASILQTEKFYDLAGSGTFILLTHLSYRWSGTSYCRQKIQSTLVTVWGLRVLKEGRDRRFNEVRTSPKQFFVYWTLQGVWIFVTLLPTLILNTRGKDQPLCVRDYTGWIIWVLGFVIEAIADQQKWNFKNHPDNVRSSRVLVDVQPAPAKRSRSIEKANDSIVAKTTLTLPNNGGPIEAVSTIETVPYWTRSRRRTANLKGPDLDAISETPSSTPSATSRSDICSTPQSNGGMRTHEFVSKTVIKPESCVPCGKRIKFGKLALKCRDCRVVSHPECRDRCALPCIPTLAGTPVKIGEGVLADFTSSKSPMIPSIVVHCINEIEQRGLSETGLYRISGCDRTVKELKEKFLKGKNMPLLSKVDDIHVICGLLKDFLRNLKEPLVTFKLYSAFVSAADITDDDNSVAAMYQAISELPQPNRDTLAFLMNHLQRVANSPNCKMDIANLSKVFGPTIVGYSTPDPSPMSMLQETKLQPKVVERFLSLPVEYWSQFTMVEQENIQPNRIIENSNAYSTPEMKVSMLGPLTTPEHQIIGKTPSSSSLSARVKSSLTKTTPKFGSKGKSSINFNRTGNFFASPLLK